MFKTISGDFDFFEFVPPNCERDDRNRTKTPKIRQNTCFLHKNAENSCQKVLETPFSRVPIIFLSCASDSPSNFGLNTSINPISRKSRFFDLLTVFCDFENRTFSLEISELFTCFGHNSSMKIQKRLKSIANESYDPGEHF